MSCSAGATCNIPSNQAALTVRLGDERDKETCNGKFRISEDRLQLIVEEGCDADFVVQTVDLMWVGGNTKVLKFGQRDGKTPFQVDPPRLLDAGNYADMPGCYQATINCENQLIISPNADCKAKLPSICEYDPLDLVLIDVKVTYDEAVAKCKAMNRPLASLKNEEQTNKALNLAKSQKIAVYISATYDATIQGFRWEDGERLAYTNWLRNPEPMRHNKEHFCVTFDTKKGKWVSRLCANKFLAMCGPPNTDTPLVFTPYYPVPGDVCMDDLKVKLRRAQCQDYICDDPAMIECSAQDESGGWVTQETQKKGTISCTKTKIACKPGHELDCSTFRVRFLCPYEDNQCKELESLEAPACNGGMMCFPVTNHYVCRCPPGKIYSDITKECTNFCGECIAWGDPHYTTFRGNKYDFMGSCTYKFTGVCNPEEYTTEPYFEIFTTNVECTNAREDGTCIQWVEISLKNIPTECICGTTIKEDFLIKTKAYENKYWINDVEMTDEIFVKDNVWKITLRNGQWSVIIHSLDLAIKLVGNHLRVQVPERFSGKLCGLCGDCDSSKFRLRNGTAIEVPKSKAGWRWDIYTMKILGDDWRVANPYSSFEKCSKNITDEECSTENKLTLQDEQLCGVFLQKGNFLQECFDKMSGNNSQTLEIRRMEFHHDCIYDICGAKYPEKAICTPLQTFAQQCATLGVTVQWRSPDRCPMDCGENEEYRTDASCQKQCNEEPGQQDQCDDEPLEGCACKDGFRRRNNKCVPKDQCGCRVLDHEGNLVKYLAPGEEAILPQCTEIVKCVKKDDGTLSMKYRDYVLPNNAVCANTVPPSYKCAKGFKFAEDNVTCIKERDSCTDPYELRDGICIHTPTQKKIWRQALYRCNAADGTLVHIDTAQKIDTVKNILKLNKWCKYRFQ
ncbi:IgG Fc-binding protein [Plakobranchus ocellatus]|uniref:IgG Fc-binding protein n=1 Tax=Plakobranchus ocellatus TaxID=259542 RepID=A0AAV4DBL9_9GAST|nr:IgG Fc-binding protein [Plakobranchus ocellatus]